MASDDASPSPPAKLPRHFAPRNSEEKHFTNSNLVPGQHQMVIEMTPSPESDKKKSGLNPGERIKQGPFDLSNLHEEDEHLTPNPVEYY